MIDDLKHKCSWCSGTGHAGHTDGTNMKHEYECPYCDGRGFKFVEHELLERIDLLEQRLSNPF
jgi:DnaJ-class molecular chaperone